MIKINGRKNLLNNLVYKIQIEVNYPILRGEIISYFEWSFLLKMIEIFLFLRKCVYNIKMVQKFKGSTNGSMKNLGQV